MFHPDSSDMYSNISSLIPRLKENDDYNIDEKMRAVTLTEQGISRAPYAESLRAAVSAADADRGRP